MYSLKIIVKGEFMSGDFETLEINQPKITYLKPESNTEWLDKLINDIEDIKKKISKVSQNLRKKLFYYFFSLNEKQFKKDLDFVFKITAFS